MRKACVSGFWVIVLVLFATGGTRLAYDDSATFWDNTKEVKKDKNNSVSVQVVDRSFVGKDVDAPYGWIQAGRKKLRDGTIDESIFYTKESLCKDALRRINLATGTGMVEDLNFYRNWCE